MITSLHLLLTYSCTYECDHCFVWGSPDQEGVMTIEMVKNIIDSAKDIPAINSIYFEGGEAFLFYPILLAGAKYAVANNLEVGIVTNAYWATTIEDAILWLKPLSGIIKHLSMSYDAYHSSLESLNVMNAIKAAEQLSISTGTITVADIAEMNKRPIVGTLPDGSSDVRFRGRAVKTLLDDVVKQDWNIFTSCPYENLAAQSRVHIDPFGYMHTCQGISIGNLFRTPIRDIVHNPSPSPNPIVSVLIEAGPVGLVEQFQLEHDAKYADACHLCYDARLKLRNKFPEILAPDAMYGEF